MKRWREVVVLLAGAALIALAYRWSGALERQLTDEHLQLAQDYRCIIANGRSLRGATFEDCADFRRRYH